MSSAYESANLLIKLYELRRDPTMRDARTWFALNFNPATLEEVTQGMTGPQSAYFRMVTSYWDMAAAFVLNGAIDEEMFNDTNGEQWVVFAKIEPFIEGFRAQIGNPGYLSSLEKLVMRTPGAQERLAGLRERFRGMAAAAR